MRTTHSLFSFCPDLNGVLLSLSLHQLARVLASHLILLLWNLQLSKLLVSTTVRLKHKMFLSHQREVSGLFMFFFYHFSSCQFPPALSALQRSRTRHSNFRTHSFFGIPLPKSDLVKLSKSRLNSTHLFLFSSACGMASWML